MFFNVQRDLPSCALFCFFSCTACVFSELFVSAAFYLSIFLLDQQFFEFSRIVLFLQLRNKFCYSFYCLFQASNSGRDCKLGVFVLSLHRISYGASCKSSGFSTSSRGLQLPSPSVSHLFLIPLRIDNS